MKTVSEFSATKGLLNPEKKRLAPPTLCAMLLASALVWNAPVQAAVQCTALTGPDVGAYWDTDGDGSIDTVDTDDDNDGLADVDEGDDSNDPDNDCIPNRLDADNGNGVDSTVVGTGDSDKDGLSDAEECPTGIPCVDTNGNGIPNYMDADDDGDGLLTKDEGASKGLDSDGDSIPDYLEPVELDTDGDGIKDQYDNDDDGDWLLTINEVNLDDLMRPRSNPLYQGDYDSDGIPNYVDAGNGDGSDPEGRTIISSGDMDGDTISDAIECWGGYRCEDTDEDQIPNYADSDDDNDNIPSIDEDTNGNGDYSDDDADNDGTPDYLDPDPVNPDPTDPDPTDPDPTDPDPTDPDPTDPDPTDPDPTDPDPTDPDPVDPDGNPEGKIKSGTGAMGGSLLGLSLVGLGLRSRRLNVAIRGTLPAVALLALPFSANADGRWYGGVGVGVSDLDPDTSETRYNVRDDSDTGYKFFVGKELSDRVSVEGFAADLGSAAIGDGKAGDVDYRMYGVAGKLSYPIGSRGLSAFGKAGVAAMDAGSKLPHETENDFSLYGGIGAEYELESGIAVRGEYEHYAEDASFLSVNVVKHFGGEEEEEETAPVQTTNGIGAPTVITDSDGDGVPDLKDKCPDTAPNVVVNERGCPKFTGVLEGVQFRKNRDILTTESKNVLNKVSKDLKRYPEVRVTVVGHTDAKGEAAYNKQLSLKRARVVASYLRTQGIEPKRLRYAGFGEERPRASNATSEGRSMNRRVELIARQ